MINMTQTIRSRVQLGIDQVQHALKWDHNKIRQYDPVLSLQAAPAGSIVKWAAIRL